jgi:hypothetical protein
MGGVLLQYLNNCTNFVFYSSLIDFGGTGSTVSRIWDEHAILRVLATLVSAFYQPELFHSVCSHSDFEH